MLRHLQIIWLLPLFLIISCSSNPIVKDNSGEPGGVVKAGGGEKKHEAYQFILSPGDEISVKVWRNDDLARSLQVDPSGNIQFPLIGEMKASGLTNLQLREKMTEKLSKYLVDPQVDIIVSSLKNLKIHVLGEVKAPGTFDWRTGMMAWEGITKAGGFTTDADENNILLIRNENGNAVIKTLNLRSMLKGENLTQDVYLINGDVIYALPMVIANVQRFMIRLTNILAPIINLESGIILYPQARDVLRGKESSGTIVVPR